MYKYHGIIFNFVPSGLNEVRAVLFETNYNMSFYFFTCGQSHTHRIFGEIVWDKDSVLRVKAKNEESATDKVFSMFGDKWSMCYGPDDISIDYYKNGICATIHA